MAKEALWAATVNMLCGNWVVLHRAFAFQLMCLWRKMSPKELMDSFKNFRLRDHLFVFDNDYKFFVPRVVGVVDLLFKQFNFVRPDGIQVNVNGRKVYPEAHLLEFIDILVKDYGFKHRTFLIEVYHSDQGRRST